MREFVLGLLVSRAARAEGASWSAVTGVAAALTGPEVNVWASAANFLGVAVPEGAL